MLNKFNQLMGIQIRNAGGYAIGCFIDGLFGMIDLLLGSIDRLHDRDWGWLTASDRPAMMATTLTGWLNLLLRPGDWHGQPDLQRHLHLRQG